MTRQFAASVLSVLLYAQALLAFAGLATVVLHEREPRPVVMAEQPATKGSVLQ